MSRRVAIAGLHMECATFLPQVTGRDVFEANTVRGGALVARYAGSNTVPGGFLASLAAAGVEAAPVLHADGSAAGLADQAAVADYRCEIVEGLQALSGRIDGVLLHLHGAMVTQDELDPDARTLDAVRAAVGPDLPIMVALDYHANLDAASIAGATAAFGYRYSPHVDMGATGARAADCLLRTMSGEIRPTMAIARVGLILPSIFSATGLSPLDELVQAAVQAAETPPAEGRYADVSLFAGFAYADVPNCGASVIAVTDDNAGAAQGLAGDLAQQMRDQRAALSAPAPIYDLDAGVARAAAQARDAARPVVVLEHADRANDSTHGLRALLPHAGDLRIAAPYLWDPAAARAAIAAGEGAVLQLALGGRSAPKAGGPLAVEATVTRVFPDFRYKGTGEMRRGGDVILGDAALLDVGGCAVSVTSLSSSAIDMDPFLQMGLDPAAFDIVLLRSKTHFRAAWEPFASEIIIIDTPDYGPADLSTLTYRWADVGG